MYLKVKTTTNSIKISKKNEWKINIAFKYNNISINGYELCVSRALNYLLIIQHNTCWVKIIVTNERKGTRYLNQKLQITDFWKAAVI